MYCIYMYKKLLTDQFRITEDCLNKFHECLTKITFVKTICLNIFFGLFQALLLYLIVAKESITSFAPSYKLVPLLIIFIAKYL